MRPEKRKYSDLRWKRKSLEVLERDKGICQNCGKTNFEVILQAHHRNYTTSDPWDEPMENLVTLCQYCHPVEQKSLGAAARNVANALMKSNWMVKHREQLQRCVEQSIISPEEFSQLVEERVKKRNRK
jgi:5-methylcytosine-specific restriction endonuclease McrA